MKIKITAKQQNGNHDRGDYIIYNHVRNIENKETFFNLIILSGNKEVRIAKKYWDIE